MLTLLEELLLTAPPVVTASPVSEGADDKEKNDVAADADGQQAGKQSEMKYTFEYHAPNSSDTAGSVTSPSSPRSETEYSLGRKAANHRFMTLSKSNSF